MKKLLVIVMTLVSIIGCNHKDFPARYIATSNGSVEFLFPEGWHENEEQHPFDLQCFSKFERMNTGVFLFMKDDLAEDLAPRELLELQIDDMRSKRNNFKVKEEETVFRLNGKKLTSVVYSGEKGPSSYYYRFTLMEFDDNPEMIAIVLQVSIPSYWKEHKPVLEEITNSARIRPPEEQ